MRVALDAWPPRLLARARGRVRALARGGKTAAAKAAARTAAVAAVSASSVVRHSRCLQPRGSGRRARPPKFRNEVKLAAWMNANYGDVVAMYEDWHSLMGVDAAGNVVTRKISVCRHSELARVSLFLRMLMSMFLEFSDVVVPVARAALNGTSLRTSRRGCS